MASIKKTWLYTADSHFKREPISGPDYRPYQELKNQIAKEEAIRKKEEIEIKKYSNNQEKKAQKFLRTSFIESEYSFTGLVELRIKYLKIREIDECDLMWLNDYCDKINGYGVEGLKNNFITKVASSCPNIHFLSEELKSSVMAKVEFWDEYLISLESTYKTFIEDLNEWVQKMNEKYG
ncbi:hypothetical protein [Peijinzhouia sedimentorum]